jgi:hypothetical protein
LADGFGLRVKQRPRHCNRAVVAETSNHVRDIQCDGVPDANLFRFLRGTQALQLLLLRVPAVVIFLRTLLGFYPRAGLGANAPVLAATVTFVNEQRLRAAALRPIAAFIFDFAVG